MSKGKRIAILSALLCHGVVFGQNIGSYAIRATSADLHFSEAQAAIFSAPPDVEKCYSGVLKASEKLSALNTLNEIRSRHNLPPVVYAEVYQEAVMASSLMMAANGDIQHQPPSGWRCFTDAGAKAAATSNLSGGVASPYLSYMSTRSLIIGWVSDLRNRSGGTGHRRWLLSPFLTQIAYGQVGWQDKAGMRTSAGTIKVFGFSAESRVRSDLPDFVAYPFGDYPAEYFAAGALLSFMPVVDKQAAWKNMDVDLASVRIMVTTGGRALPVTISDRSKMPFGYTTAIEFSVAGMAADVPYHVKVDSLSYEGKPLSYEYDFRLSD